MSSHSQRDAAPNEYYSNLETVYHSPNSAPKADTGPQVHYFNGDDGPAAKEVYHTDVYNVNSAHGGWKKRRIWGMPMIVFIAILTLVLVGGIVGGVVGGKFGAKKNDPTSPVPNITIPPEQTSTGAIAKDFTAIDTSAALSSSTNAFISYPTPDLPSNWWHSIETDNLVEGGETVLTNIYKPDLGGNLKTKNYIETVDKFGNQYYQHWQFYAIASSHEDSNFVRDNPDGVTMLYRLAARNPGQETLLVLNNGDYDGWKKGVNTSAVNIRLDMVTDPKNDGRFWFLEKMSDVVNGYWIYNYKLGKDWWLAAETTVELGNEGLVYMTSVKKNNFSGWFMVERDFIKPEYNWVV